MIKSLYFYLTQIFFLLMLVVPARYQMPRGILLAILVMGLVISLIRGHRWRLNENILIWGCVCIGASVIFMVNGYFHDGPGAIEVGTVYVIWPIFYIFLAGYFNCPRQLMPFMATILIGAISASLLGILFVAQEITGLNLGINSFIDSQGGSFGSYEGFIKFSLPNLTTVIYALPFLLAQSLLPKEVSKLRGWHSGIHWVGILLCIVTLMISARKGFWFIAVLSPFITLILFKLSGIRFNYKKFTSKTILIVVFAIATAWILDIEFSAIFGHLEAGFDFGDVTNISANTRQEQFYALIDGWLKSPIFGNGHGTAAPLFEFRDKDLELGRAMPWAYELSYVALLFHTGLFGIAIYGGALVWLYRGGIQIARRIPNSANMIIPSLAGLTCFLIANATNPYLEKFDYLWVIFFPVAILNSYLIHK